MPSILTWFKPSKHLTGPDRPNSLLCHDTRRQALCLQLHTLTVMCLSVQTEKQRLIWAYKILFLDVLFPLNLGKVIFCDSDQVVRGDMAELWNMDLKVSRTETLNLCNIAIKVRHDLNIP